MLTDTSVAATERMTHSWDLVGRLGLQHLAYKGFTPTAEDAGGLSAAGGGRLDTGHLYGAGVGYRPGENLRLGFDATSYARRSALTVRDYDGFRFGASITYGLAQ